MRALEVALEVGADDAASEVVARLVTAAVEVVQRGVQAVCVALTDLVLAGLAALVHVRLVVAHLGALAGLAAHAADAGFGAGGQGDDGQEEKAGHGALQGCRPLFRAALPVAQLATQDLARSGLGNGVDELDRPDALVAGQVLGDALDGVGVEVGIG